MYVALEEFFYTDPKHLKMSNEATPDYHKYLFE